MKKIVLVVTNEKDVHADAVISVFNQRNIPFVRFHTDAFPLKNKLVLELPDLKNSMIFSNNNAISLSEIGSVWYRRPKDPVISAAISNPEYRNIAISESKVALENVWRILERMGVLFINSPDAIEVSNSKLLQLQIAQGIGFETPISLISNDPKYCLDFFEKNKEIIVKAMRQPRYGDAVIYTNKVSKKSLSNIGSVALSPTYFQSYIPKKLELRITVIGNNVFSVAIDSQNHEQTMVDWRRNVRLAKHSPFSLPKQISDQCVSLVKNLNLSFGAIDMIITPDDRFVFLEINPNGQWLWVEREAGLPIADSIATLLSSVL